LHHYAKEERGKNITPLPCFVRESSPFSAVKRGEKEKKIPPPSSSPKKGRGEEGGGGNLVSKHI